MKKISSPIAKPTPRKRGEIKQFTIVVSDTWLICYLLLIGEIELLPQLYGQVLIPRIVQQELSDARSPIAVKNWIKAPPKWLIIQDVTIPADKDLDIINAGEKAAIILALQEGANLIIIDEAIGLKSCPQ